MRIYIMFVVYVVGKDGKEREYTRFPHNELKNAAEFAKLVKGRVVAEKRYANGTLPPVKPAIPIRQPTKRKPGKPHGLYGYNVPKW